MSPICLPAPDQEFTGVTAVAAGWGRYAPPDVSRTQSKVLRWVNLVVSAKRYSTHKMFGTILSKIGNKYMDVCSGDSGKVRDLFPESKVKWRIKHEKLRRVLYCLQEEEVNKNFPIKSFTVTWIFVIVLCGDHNI